MFEAFNNKINYKHLEINYDQILKISEKLGELFIPNWNDQVFYIEETENDINFIFLINTINFSYWNDENSPKWFYLLNGQKYTGSFALFAAFKDAIENGYPLFNPQYLKSVSENDLKNILEKYQPIPMFNQRLEILRNIGKNMVENDIKSFFDIYNSSSNSAINLINKIIDIFHSFKDLYTYNGNNYNFLKRAQLIPAMIYGRYQNQKDIFSDIDKLTVFADYRVPQTIRKLGLIEYSKELNNKIAQKVYLESGSSEELEIRISTIQIGLLLKEAMKAKAINSLHLDYYLWKEGKEIITPDYDFHRTRNIYY